MNNPCTPAALAINGAVTGTPGMAAASTDATLSVVATEEVGTQALFPGLRAIYTNPTFIAVATTSGFVSAVTKWTGVAGDLGHQAVAQVQAFCTAAAE